jgi:hypothetical protein
MILSIRWARSCSSLCRITEGIHLAVADFHEFNPLESVQWIWNIVLSNAENYSLFVCLKVQWEINQSRGELHENRDWTWMTWQLFVMRCHLCDEKSSQERESNHRNQLASRKAKAFAIKPHAGVRFTVELIQLLKLRSALPSDSVHMNIFGCRLLLMKFHLGDEPGRIYRRSVWPGKSELIRRWEM